MTFSYSCDKDDHYTIYTQARDSGTPDCPQCHQTMEEHDELLAEVILHDLIPFFQAEMEAKKRVCYWYNITQTLTFLPGGEIRTSNHGTLTDLE